MHLSLNKKNFNISAEHLLCLRNSKMQQNTLKCIKGGNNKDNYVHRLNIGKIEKNRLDRYQ